MGKFVIEEEVLIVNETIFGDSVEHCFDFKCYNGYAIGELSGEDDHTNVTKIKMTYPKRAEVLKNADLCEEVLEYRGLYDLKAKDITYGDIMMYAGEPSVIE